MEGPADRLIVGFTEVEALVRGADTQEHLSLLVDSGARFTLLPHDVPLLGVITLEQFGLILNPFNRTLQPARMLLARVA